MESRTSYKTQHMIDLPPDVVDRIQQFRRDGVSGSIQINFNSGNIESWQAHEHYRVKP